MPKESATPIVIDILQKIAHNSMYEAKNHIINELFKLATNKDNNNNRPLRKLAYREEFEGDTEHRTAAYLNVREDSSTGSTYKLPLEVEFPKKSNIVYDYDRSKLVKAYYTLSRANPNAIENTGKEIKSFSIVQSTIEMQKELILAANKNLKSEDFKSLRKEIDGFKEALDKQIFMQGSETVIKNHLKQKKIDNIIQEALDALKGTKGFISDELIKLAQSNNGQILIHTADFREARTSLLLANSNSDKNKGKDVKSLGEIVRKINKGLDKILTDNKELFLEKDFKSFRKEIELFQQTLTNQLYTNTGVKKLIETRFATKLFDRVFIMSLDENNKPTDIDRSLRKDFFEQITPYISIPEKLMNGMLKGNDIRELEQVINTEIIKRFTTKGDGKTWGVLDNNKISAINIEQAVISINQLVKTCYKLGVVQEVQAQGNHTAKEINRRNNKANSRQK